MRFWRKISSQSWFPYSVSICIGILFFSLLSNLDDVADFLGGIWAIIKPLLYGLILAYLIDPIARFYQNKPFSRMKNKQIARNFSVVLAIITVLVVIVGLCVAIIPQLAKSISNIANMLSEWVNKVDQDSSSVLTGLPFGLGNALKDFSFSTTILDEVSGVVTSNLSNIADASVTIGTGFANFLIAFILAVYYLMDKTRLKAIAAKLLSVSMKEGKFELVNDFLKRADKILLRYIKCSILEAVIVGVINAIFMAIAGIPYVLLISITIGITNLAPTFGPIVGALIGTIMLALTGNWVYVIAFLIFTVVLQTVDGYILKPRLFGETLGVSPLLVLIAVIVGGRIWGVVGILIAIPIAAIIQFTIDDVLKRRKERKTPEIKAIAVNMNEEDK